MKTIELKDLTKKELITLFRKKHPFAISQYDMLSAKWETITEECLRLQEKSVSVLEEWSRATNTADRSLLYDKADKLWKKATRLEKEAERIHKQMSAEISRTDAMDVVLNSREIGND